MDRMTEDPLDLVGDVLDQQFRIDAFAGEGAMSVVYKGRHLGVDAPVAIKCLHLPSSLDEALARPIVEAFHEGCRLHYRLARGSLNVAQTMASGTTIAPRTGATVPYLVREWFEGESLAANLRLRRAEDHHGRSLEAAVALLESAAEGLGYAHAQRIAHLSVNPSNLFLARRGDAETTRVLDFGVGRAMDAAVPEVQPPQGVGLHMLFPAYAAPEQLLRTLGATGPSSDVYSFALVFLEVLSDRRVIDETTFVATVDRVLDPKVRPSALAHGVKVSEAVEAVLAKAFALDPAQRHASVTALFIALQEAARGHDSLGRSANTRHPTNPSLFRRLRRRRTPAAVRKEADATEPPKLPPLALVEVVPPPSECPPSLPTPVVEPLPASLAPSQPDVPAQPPMPKDLWRPDFREYSPDAVTGMKVIKIPEPPEAVTAVRSVFVTPDAFLPAVTVVAPVPSSQVAPEPASSPNDEGPFGDTVPDRRAPFPFSAPALVPGPIVAPPSALDSIVPTRSRFGPLVAIVVALFLIGAALVAYRVFGHRASVLTPSATPSAGPTAAARAQPRIFSKNPAS